MVQKLKDNEKVVNLTSAKLSVHNYCGNHRQQVGLGLCQNVDKMKSKSRDSTDSANGNNNFEGKGEGEKRGRSGGGRILGSRPIAVRVRNADMCYGRKEPPIMKGLNMTLEEGTIYTLLGSSGCGKTTLLNCIIGFQKVDAGEILVFGRPPCSKGSGVPGQLVGYMPQEISLYPTLTIGELLEYFGMLYGMSKSEIKERSLFLIKFLQLPKSSQVVGDLSGGQQRRTSFAVSLMPDPPLLILDEPTVGVDPLLRENIWDHLVDLVSRKKTTVLITTHYMEESRKSDMIGFMRNGRLLIEQSPKSLMDQHGLSMITPIVLKLCRNDITSSIQPSCCHLPPKPPDTLGVVISSAQRYSQQQLPPNDEVLSSTTLQRRKQSGVLGRANLTKNHIFAMIKKNALLMTRNYIILLFLICVPAIQATLFCLAVGEDPKELPFGVVNNELQPSESCPEYTANINPDCNPDLLSCRFLAKIPQDKILLMRYYNRSSAHEALTLGRIWGYMDFPSNFSQFMTLRFMLENSRHAFDNETFFGSKITLEVDASSKQITSTYYNTFSTAFLDFSHEMLNSCQMDNRTADLPLTYMTPMFGDFKSAFRDFLAPSLVLGILFFFPMISAAMQSIRERKQGTYQRSYVAGIRTWETLAAYSVTESVIVMFQTAVGFFIVSILFQIQIKGSVALVFALCIVVGLCGVSVGFLIGTFCREETDAALLSMAIFFPNFMLSGMFWPVEGLPTVLRYMSYGLPCTLASEAIRSIINRGWGFVHPKVWPGFAIAGGWIVVYWTLNVILQRIAARKKKCSCC